MNFIEKEFINTLKAYVNGEKINVALDNKEIWEKFLEESKEHCVDGVVYSAINWGINNEFIDKNLKNDWKNRVFFQGVGQINHIKKTCLVFNEFNKQEIEFITLKGFIIRNFYKRPEHRTMGDIDILIRKKELQRVANCLYGLGYKKDGEARHHVGFEKQGYPSIEVHWNLINRDYFKNEVPLEDELWKSVKKTDINGVEVLAMSMEDMLVHLCLHMAVHIAHGGFGIRQLLDIALIVKEENDINWSDFKEKAKRNSIDKFSYLIILMCNMLFHTEIPKELQGSFNVNKKELDVFIEDILKSGVHGKREAMASFKAEAAFDLGEESISNNILKRYLELIFPPPTKMSNKYSYAKRFNILLPIAWVHHLFNGLFNKEYKFKEKINFISINILKSYKRNKLLKWLELS